MKYDNNDSKLDRRHGGITTKIHLLCDSDAKPKNVIIMRGYAHDVKVLLRLIK